jgi:NAD(P)-dependent dehydrogenase (short-subunit alcohol dehydrogenase family)
MNTPVVLITGALTGIGRATALAFAEEGARIVVSGRRDEEGRKLVVELRKRGVEAEFLSSDCVTTMMCAIWSKRPSGALVVWMRQSIALEPKVHPAR